jgi:spore maturation protein CgeB
MKIVYFTHSLVSCWNHGNAHFLRGVLRALVAMGHEVVAFEPADGWSRANLERDHGQAPAAAFTAHFPELVSRRYPVDADLDQLVDGADLVVVHEWTEPRIVAGLGALRAAGARFALFFHDTHHRAVSDPDAIRAFALDAYDGVLAFGRSLAEVYRGWGWGERVHVWHEAADVSVFHPLEPGAEPAGLVWIGNWGDGERSDELKRFLFEPARAAGLPLDVHGVRYPDAARRVLDDYGARYHGWLANLDVPRVFARHNATVHVPRRFYADALPGIPTIRVFEALACGIPLVSAPWADDEHLFTPGADYLVARDGEEMTAHLRALAADAELRRGLRERGLATIRARHTCAHRARALLVIAGKIAPDAGARAEVA